MKILLISASSRLNGNSDILADAFTKGAVRSGNKVTRISLASMRINPCSACDLCASNGNPKGCPCVQNDDMAQIYKLVNENELVVFAMPLYFYTFPAKLKALIDRFYGYYMTGGYPKREAMLLAVAADDAPNTFDALKLTYGQIMGHLEWKDRGTYFVKGVMAKGDINSRAEVLDDAEKLGASLT